MHIHISYEGSRIYDKRGDANRRHFLQTSYIDKSHSTFKTKCSNSNVSKTFKNIIANNNIFPLRSKFPFHNASPEFFQTSHKVLDNIFLDNIMVNIESGQIIKQKQKIPHSRSSSSSKFLKKLVERVKIDTTNTQMHD